MCLAPYVFYPINPILLPSTFFFENYIEMQLLTQKTNLQMKTNQFRELNLLRHCSERVFVSRSVSCRFTLRHPY